MHERSRFALLLTAGFLVVEALLMLNHEMWQDELHPWLTVVRSESLPAMFRHTLIEEQPRLWYLMLYGMSLFGDSPYNMQLLHWLIAGAIVYVFARYSPFSKGQKILFVFGRLMLYEFGTLARCYSTAVLLLFVFCSMFHARRKRFLCVCGLLFLLANINVDGLIMAVSIAMALAIEQIESRKTSPIPTNTMVAGYCVVFLGCIIAAVQCFYPGQPLNYGISLMPRLLDLRCILTSPATVAHGFIPLSSPQADFFSVPLVLDTYHPGLKTAIGALMIVWGLLLFLRTRTTLLFWLFSTFGMALFFAVIPRAGHLRHFGYYYFIFIASMWMMRQEDDRPPAVFLLRKLTAYARSFADGVLYMLLVIQVLCSLYPVYADLKFPFSCGKGAARWIEETGRREWLFAAYKKNPATSIMAYLGKDVYALAYDSVLPMPWYVEGKRAEEEEITQEDVMKKVPGLRDRYGDDILFIFSEQPLPGALMRRYDLVETARFDDAIMFDENFYIYTFKSVQGPRLRVPVRVDARSVSAATRGVGG